jgi:phytoene synthase
VKYVVDPKAELKAELLEGAYKECSVITEDFSKTFSAGTKLMTEEQRKATVAIYVWCRRTDDLVDNPRIQEDAAQMTADLNVWRARLHDLWDKGSVNDLLDVALLDTKHRYPSMSIAPYLDMIEGMVMDTPQFGQNRYQTWDDLYTYCYRVASTVGLMTLPVLGTAPGYTEEQAKAPAVALGIALQITNILRDVGEDRLRGRIYLPQEDLARFGVTDEQVLEGRIDSNYIDLVKFEIQRARDYYQEAEAGIHMLAPDSRLSVQVSSEMYSEILTKIEENAYDNINKRAYTTSFEKFGKLLSSWWKVIQMS